MYGVIVGNFTKITKRFGEVDWGYGIEEGCQQISDLPSEAEEMVVLSRIYQWYKEVACQQYCMYM